MYAHGIHLHGPGRKIFSRTSIGHEYALTVICMLTGYIFCIPLKTKSAEEIVDKYHHPCCLHLWEQQKDSCQIMVQSSRTALFEEVAKQLGVERKIYSPVYRPQACTLGIEGFHELLKECISKHLVKSLDWDDILPLAAAAYNWFLNEHSKEPAFFLNVQVRCGNTFC